MSRHECVCGMFSLFGRVVDDVVGFMLFGVSYADVFVENLLGEE